MYEIKLIFQLEKPEVPEELDKLMVSFFKASIEKHSPELFERLYTKKASVIKTYCWACYLPGANFTKDKIRLNKNEFTITFTDADMGEFIEFFNAFQLMRYKKYPTNKNSMTLISVKIRKLPPIKDTELIIKMQSSLVVRKHNSLDNTDIYYTCEDDEFSEMVKENLKIFLQKLNIEMDIESFSITPIKAKKVVAKVWQRPTDANIGLYKITGSVQLLELLYTAGLGTRRSLGHGKWEIVY